jgi:transcriptional regulator with XRE-family HTH domain
MAIDNGMCLNVPIIGNRPAAWEIPVADVSPTFRRRELGVRLRQLRTNAGMTVEDVASRLLCSASKISRMETGHRAASQRDVRDLCVIYGVSDPGEQESLMSLARASKERGWWQEFEDLGIPVYIGLENRADSISIFHSTIVPGLFQTKEYAQAVIRGILPGIREEVLQSRVTARLKRQERLDEAKPPLVITVLDEAVLHRHVGTATIMAKQIKKLMEIAARPNVTIQVITYELGAYSGMDSIFTLLEFSDPPLPGLVSVEGLAGQLYLEGESNLQRYREAFALMRARALDPNSSVLLMDRLRQQLLDFDARGDAR